MEDTDGVCEMLLLILIDLGICRMLKALGSESASFDPGDNKDPPNLLLYDKIAQLVCPFRHVTRFTLQ